MINSKSKTITLHDISGKQHAISTSEIKWRPSVYAIIIKDNKVLLAKEEGSYTLPGGGVNIGEEFEEALSREVKEETGVSINGIKPYSFKSNFFVMQGSKNRNYVQSILLYYLADYYKGVVTLEHIPPKERKYHQLAEWISLEDINNIKINSTYDWRELIEAIS